MKVILRFITKFIWNVLVVPMVEMDTPLVSLKKLGDTK